MVTTTKSQPGGTLRSEDLAIQDTLLMSEEDRIDLLVNVMVEIIVEAEKTQGTLHEKIMGTLS